MWSDSVTLEEVEASLRAAEQLAKVPWAQPLLSRARPTLTWLGERLRDRTKHSGRRPQPQDRSDLFEIRYALALHASGCVARYEFPAGVDGTTVDFAVGARPEWLQELVSFGASDVILAGTTTSPHQFAMMLSTASPEASEEGEYISAVGRIGAKVFDGKRVIKFPEPSPNGPYNMIVVDGRALLGGASDFMDWEHFVQGHRGLPEPGVRRWPDESGQLVPVKALFEAGNPTKSARFVRKRIHIVAVVLEQTFALGEIRDKIWFFPNQVLFRDDDAARAALAKFPLWRGA